MTFLTPLGLLAAIAIAVLIIIYIIRPNYQQKYISSTFVWKLSLKYKKKRIPTSKLRDILIIICQIMTLACCTLVLAQPVKLLKAIVNQNEIVIILDASSSMNAACSMTAMNGNLNEIERETRYMRAVDALEKQALQVLESGGYVTVIRADDKPAALLNRITKDDISEFNDVMDALNGSQDNFNSGFSALSGCGYGAADIDAAMQLCENVLDVNPSAVTYLYTDVEYLSVPESIIVVDCRFDDEQLPSYAKKGNVGILDVETEFYDGSYQFKVRVASYGSNESFGLKLTLEDVENGKESEGASSGRQVTVKTVVNCAENQEKIITFKYITSNNKEADDTGSSPADESDADDVKLTDPVITYGSAKLSIITEQAASSDGTDGDKDVYIDSYDRDDVYELPGSQLPELKIVYASALRTPFFEGILDTFEDTEKSYFKGMWAVTVDRLRPEADVEQIKGYDFYIFEGKAPSRLPTDGAVFLVDVPTLPAGISGSYGNRIQSSDLLPLTSANPNHPIVRVITPEEIGITQAYTFNYGDNDGYTSLLDYNGRTLFAVKNSVAERAAILTFSSKYSNISVKPEFALTIGYMIDYFLPATLNKSVYTVGESVSVNSRAFDVTVKSATDNNSGDEQDDESNMLTFSEFPASFNVYKSGNYLVRTTLDENGTRFENRYITIKTPSAESNVFATGDRLYDPYHGAGYEDFIEDLVMYVAAALVFFMFAEWLLHLREGI